MSIRPFKLEVDNTGVNPNNLVPAELHTLQGSGKRFIVTDNGPFYTASLILVDLATGKPLAPRTQYTAIQLEEDATTDSGKEVCSIIIIDDVTVSSRVAVTYQAYGGWMSYSITAIKEMIENLDLDNRVIHWADIVGKPDRYPPAPHAHPLSDIYGWHKLFPSLNAIREAILTSDQAIFDQIRESFGLEIARLDAKNNDLLARLNRHMNDLGNPHNVTIHQIDGLSSSEIYALLELRLPLHATADNSMKLEGRSFLQTRDEIVRGIQNSELVNGLFNKVNMGENWNTTDPSLLLTRDGWKNFKTHETQFGRNIHEMDGYTTSEILNLLAQRLPLHATADNSAALEGRSFAGTRAEIVGSIQNPELTRGLFNKNNLGENWNGANNKLVLTATGWREFATMAGENGIDGGAISWSGGMRWAQVQTAYADMTRYKAGTSVVFVYNNYTSWGTGNGSNSSSVPVYGIMMKIAAGQWIHVAGTGAAYGQGIQY